MYIIIDGSPIHRDLGKNELLLEMINEFLYKIKWKIYHIFGKRTLEDIAGGAGLRQAMPLLHMIQKSHLARYEMACNYIQKNNRVLDLASGVGYGSFLIAKWTDCHFVTAIDLSQEAIDYGRKYYKHEKIVYKVADFNLLDLSSGRFDVIISFETLEHVDASKLLALFSRLLVTNGTLIISTPNEKVCPFSTSQFIHHQRHYTPQEFTSILESHRFAVKHRFSQPDSELKVLNEGWDGKFMIAIANKQKNSG
jgi:2-polyprenyl-3-methyl-5-hydroxy-6-metoxy-1,4-benzoquinol methylase